MEANEFVKKYGWEKVKVLISECADNYTHVTNDARMLINEKRYKEFAPHFHESLNDTVRFSELKRLVKSWELVEKHGGIDSLNDLFYVHGMNSARVMKVGNLTYADAMQAIADVESCND